MIGRAIKSSRLFLYRTKARIQNKTIVHFLHIGKSGGTAVKAALGNKDKPLKCNDYYIFSHPHNYTLMHTCKGEKVFFFVRDPIDRFISGFYSRQRKGRPRIYREWSKGEKIAFEHFGTPNELGMALSSENTDRKQQAIDAMKSIYHVKSSYWDWFKNPDYLLSRLDDIAFVGTQKNLNDDFLRLKKTFNLPESIKLPQDNVNTHKNPDNLDKRLDSQAIANLKKWYADDYMFLDHLADKGFINKGSIWTE